jgi:hypothetical protein
MCDTVYIVMAESNENEPYISIVYKSEQDALDFVKANDGKINTEYWIEPWGVSC